MKGDGEWKHAKGQSTVAYDPPGRRAKCIGKDHTCGGYRIEGSKYCAGHDRGFRLMKEKLAKRKVLNGSRLDEHLAKQAEVSE